MILKKIKGLNGDIETKSLLIVIQLVKNVPEVHRIGQGRVDQADHHIDRGMIPKERNIQSIQKIDRSLESVYIVKKTLTEDQYTEKTIYILHALRDHIQVIEVGRDLDLKNLTHLELLVQIIIPPLTGIELKESYF